MSTKASSRHSPRCSGAGLSPLLWVALGLLAIVACTDRQRRNPLDPRSQNPVEVTTGLTAVAGDAEVRLSWDYTHFEDLLAVRLYRTDATGDVTVRSLDLEVVSMVDDEVVNGTQYRYDLALVVAGEGEGQPRDTQLATPGPELAWVADAERGLVWQISPDSRSSRFSRGRFPSLAALALNRSNGACWVSDRRVRGLHWIAADGELGFAPARLERPGALSLSQDGGTGWVADDGAGAVYWFVPQTADSLDLIPVDAVLREPISLEAAGPACWMADRADGRVLLYSRDGARLGEWHQLEEPVAVVAGRVDPPVGWALTRGGLELVRLEPGQPPVQVSLPFTPMTALSADPANGGCWVLGETGLVGYDLQGNQVFARLDLEGGTDLTVGPESGRFWIAARGEVRKHSRTGQELARLGGFGSLVQVMVDPGGH